MKKKVAHIDFHYDMLNQEHGSAQKVIQSFLDNVKEFNSISLSVSEDKYYEKVKNGVKYYVVRENKIKNKIMNKILGLNVFTYDKMIRIINVEKPDILHFHNRHNLVDKIYSRLSYNPKVICHYHLHFKKPYIPKCCDLILGVSKTTEQYIKKVSKSKIRSSYVLNPVSFDLTSEKLINNNCKGKQIKLLFGAGDDEKKGYKEIEQALYKLNELNIDYILYMCGNKKKLDFESNLNIKTKGFLISEDFYKMMKECDILLFPSHFEPFGLTVLEGMFNRIKVLPSKCGGVIEILEEDYPYYCKVKDSDSIVNNIIKLSNLTKIEEKKLFDFYEQRLKLFSPKNITNILEVKYKEVLNENL